MDSLKSDSNPLAKVPATVDVATVDPKVSIWFFQPVGLLCYSHYFWWLLLSFPKGVGPANLHGHYF
ncbi:unnamed protein product [Brassica napus]|uniref:(rape) hypothetical protein n=1 Tax=Brassica napus TaxID=3708 RepID=A0A816S606_BRANA|nr:unnamed protein product [Brassica napus]